MFNYVMQFGLVVSLFVASSVQLNKDQSSVKVTGTSSLHDWEMTVNKVDMKANLESGKLNNVTFEAVAFSLESGKSIMDDKAYDALQAKAFPKIIFKADQLNMSNGQLSGKGTLTIADESRPINVALQYEKTSNTLKITGAVPVTMSDFGIDPPTAMFGTLKTGDDVKVHLDLNLNL